MCRSSRARALEAMKGKMVGQKMLKENAKEDAEIMDEDIKEGNDRGVG